MVFALLYMVESTNKMKYVLIHKINVQFKALRLDAQNQV